MNKGDKYIIEIAEVQECHDDNGNAFQLGRVKGFKALTLDELALKKLQPLVTCEGCRRQGTYICMMDNGTGMHKLLFDDDYCSYGERKEEE